MSDEIVPDLSNENENHPNEENEEISKNSEEQSSSSTPPPVAELDDVQSFCAEFHIKVENAAGIRPWLQFSDTIFPGKIK
jgi:16S rRNA U1498 N3-methylase RsmE